MTEDGHVYAWGNGNLSAELKAEGESAGDTDHKLQNIVRLASVGNVFTVSDANGTTYAWGERLQFTVKKFHQTNLFHMMK